MVWLVPVLVVTATGWLGSLGVPLLLPTWLALLGAATAGVFVHVALEPAVYAERLALVVGILVGVSLLLLLSAQTGHAILR